MRSSCLITLTHYYKDGQFSAAGLQMNGKINSATSPKSLLEAPIRRPLSGGSCQEAPLSESPSVRIDEAKIEILLITSERVYCETFSNKCNI